MWPKPYLINCSLVAMESIKYMVNSIKNGLEHNLKINCIVLLNIATHFFRFCCWTEVGRLEFYPPKY